MYYNITNIERNQKVKDKAFRWLVSAVPNTPANNAFHVAKLAGPATPTITSIFSLQQAIFSALYHHVPS